MPPAISPVIAIVDDDDLMRGALQGLLKEAGFSTRAFASGEEFLASANTREHACLIADVRMPGMSGIDLQARLNADEIKIPIIFITAHGNAQLRMQAMRAGAVELLVKPFDDEVLLDSVRTALKRWMLRAVEQSGLDEARFGQIIGRSAALESLLTQVERVAPTDSTVIIQGRNRHR